MFITFVMELHSNTKNFKNLTNLISHQDDHQLSAEWHFFCHKHKCLLTQSSFQNNHNLNVDLIYDSCVNNIAGIIFIKINSDETSENFLCKKDIHLLIVFNT